MEIFSFLFMAVAAGTNAAVYAHAGTTLSLGVAVFCGIAALKTWR